MEPRLGIVVTHDHKGKEPPLAASRTDSAVLNRSASRRISFAQIHEPIEVPNLIGLQTESFDWLLGNDIWKARVDAAKTEGRSDVPEVAGLQEIFEEISPIHHVDKIKIPIFIIHGKDDSNVSIRQSKMLKSELSAHGVPHEYHFVGDEGHNVFDLKKRVDTYERILAFLNEHLK